MAQQRYACLLWSDVVWLGPRDVLASPGVFFILQVANGCFTRGNSSRRRQVSPVLATSSGLKSSHGWYTPERVTSCRQRNIRAQESSAQGRLSERRNGHFAQDHLLLAQNSDTLCVYIFKFYMLVIGN